VLVYFIIVIGIEITFQDARIHSWRVEWKWAWTVLGYDYALMKFIVFFTHCSDHQLRLSERLRNGSQYIEWFALLEATEAVMQSNCSDSYLFKTNPSQYFMILTYELKPFVEVGYFCFRQGSLVEAIRRYRYDLDLLLRFRCAIIRHKRWSISKRKAPADEILQIKNTHDLSKCA
jgi:hypothetical protein